jgi:hypothetical protein
VAALPTSSATSTATGQTAHAQLTGSSSL